MDTFRLELRIALRSLVRDLGRTVTVVLVLAAGIASVTSVFSIVNALFLRPLPFEQPERLVQLSFSDGEEGVPRPIPTSTYLEWKEHSEAFSDLGAYYFGRVVTTGREPTRVAFVRVTPNFFELLGVKPLLGRAFGDEDENGARVALLSESFWRSRYGGRPEALGRALEIEGDPYTIVGVLPSEVAFPERRTEVWTPVPLRPRSELFVVGRLRPGATLVSARAELAAASDAVGSPHPDADRIREIRVVPLRQALLLDFDTVLSTSRTASAAVALLLLIVCANVVNLLLIRATRRRREIAIRGALGASRARILRLFLIESSFLTLAATVLAVLFTLAILTAAAPFFGDGLYRVGEIELDRWSLGLALLSSSVVSLVCGIVPAFHGVKRAPMERLKGRTAARGSRDLGRSTLTTVQVTIAILLLAGSVLFGRSLLRVLGEDIGFDPGDVLAVELELPITKYPRAEDHERFYDDVLERVKRIPGVVAASSVDPLPLAPEPAPRSVEVSVGRGLDSTLPLSSVGLGYFATMGIPLLRGHDFTALDDDRAAKVLILEERLARRYWPDEEAVGETMAWAGDPSRKWTVVGVVGNSKRLRLDEDPSGGVYAPHRQVRPRKRFLVVRTGDDPLRYAAEVRNAIRSVDEHAPILSVRSMEQVLSESVTVRKGATFAVIVVGAGSLLLAALGIYGTVSYSVQDRSREIGLRSALGASPGDNLRLVIGRTAALTAVGTVLGLAVAVPLSRLCESLLYGVRGLDPATMVGTVLVLGLIALTSAYLPARKASRIEPSEVLRQE